MHRRGEEDERAERERAMAEAREERAEKERAMAEAREERAEKERAMAEARRLVVEVEKAYQREKEAEERIHGVVVPKLLHMQGRLMSKVQGHIAGRMTDGRTALQGRWRPPLPPPPAHLSVT